MSLFTPSESHFGIPYIHIGVYMCITLVWQDLRTSARQDIVSFRL